MYRKSAFFIMVLVAVLSMGCQIMDSLFFSTEAVKPSELASFEGSTPSDKDEALTSAVMGIFMAVSSTEDLFPAELFSEIPALSRVLSAERSTSALYGRTLALARSISPSDGFEEFFEDMEETGKGSTKVTLSNEDFDSDIITVNGTVELSADGFTDTSTEASAAFKADLEATVDEIEDTVFNGALVSLKVDMNGEAELDQDYGIIESLSGYAAIAISAGFSLDESEYNEGGKYIISLKYTSNYDVEISDDAPTSSLSLVATLKVYNAANKLVGDYEYTDDEIEDFIMEMEE